NGWPKLYLPELGVGFVFAVLVILLSHSEGLYQSRVDRRYLPGLLTKIMVWSTLLVEVAIQLGGFPISSRQLILSGLLSFGTLLVMRGWRGHAGRNGRSRKRIRNVLIVGAGASGREIAAYIECHPELDRVLCGFLDDSGPGCPGVLGPPAKLAAIARAKFIDEVIFATPHRPDLAQFVIRESRRNHLDVKVVPYFYGCEFQQPRLENLGAISLITLHTEKAPAAALFVKRILDFVLSTLALLLTFPLLLMIAAVVRLDSKGPAIYAASRVGRKGRRFRCYKFRTMISNAAEGKDLLRARNERDGPCFKVAKDPRVTHVGRWLRRYSLDELPQLWNVWKGEMSLVGPRPHPVDDFSRYQLSHFRRLDVMPGITGLWQVTARQHPSFETTMALDLEYIEQWSLAMDLKILFATIGVVARGTGS
ncbi:MAG: sugar transferase, partial [Acidobacteria bacterium]